MKVAIVGAGMMGTAVVWPLSDNGHQVRLIGTHLDGDIIQSCQEKRFHPTLRREIPSEVQASCLEDIAHALEDADIIVSGVNSLGAHWIGRAIGPYLQPGQMIIAVTKGLEVTRCGDPLILPDVLAAELPDSLRDQVTVAAIGGPCIAGELAGRRQSYVVFGSRDRDAVEQLASVFRTSYYHISTTIDLEGLEVCAALKNGYALGVGMVSGLLAGSGGADASSAHMHNLAAAIFSQACVEIERMLEIVNATRAFAYGLPGAGDLHVTCQGGRTSRLGRLLGLGHSFAEARELMAGETLETVEIVRAMGEMLPKLEARGQITAEEFPLMRLLVEAIVRDRPVDELFAGASTNLAGWL